MLKRETTVDNFTARERFLESTEGVLQQILQGVSDKRAGDCKRPQKWREIVNNHWKYRKKGKNKAPWRSASVHLHTGPPAMYQYFLARTTWAPSAPFCVAVTDRYWSPTTTLKAKRRSKMRGWNPIIFSCLSFFSSSRVLIVDATSSTLSVSSSSFPSRSWGLGLCMEVLANIRGLADCTACWIQSLNGFPPWQVQLALVTCMNI